MDREVDRDELYVRWTEDRRAAAPLPLSEWLERYPSCREDLLLWTADAPIADLAERRPTYPDGEARAEAAGARAVAEFRARYQSPIESLLSSAQQRGLLPADLAARVGIGEPVLYKLERRMLLVATVPGTLVRRIAQTLAVSVDQIAAYVAQPPALARGAMYKSDRAPRVGAQQEFAAAVRTCPEMAEEEKSYWLELAARECGQDG